MRISTSMLYEKNVSTMGRQQTDLVQTQQQLASGKRVVAPSDDPVAASRALEVGQAASQVKQYMNNQGTATDALSILETKFAALGELLIYSRERAVQAGNAALSPQDRQAISVDLRAQFENLLGVANSTDANGEYIFSGFKGDTVPFNGSLVGGISYQGDQGQRTLQVGSSRFMPVSDNGQDVFMRVPNLNGAFNTRPGTVNSGSAFISDGTVTGAYAGGQYGIRFTAPNTYAIFDRGADPAMTGAPLATGAYSNGSPIALPPAPAAPQIEVRIGGTPAVGDTFQIDPGGNTDMFTIYQQFIFALENPSANGYADTILETLGRLDNALENVLKLRAQVGARQVELDALKGVGEDLQLQYADRINRLVGLDYVGAISDLQLQQTYLQASQQSFVKISGLSLFNFIS